MRAVFEKCYKAVDGSFTGQLAQKPAHDGRLQMNDFLRAFAQLPAEQREALALIGVAGFSYEEAAVMCDVAVGTIKSRANRARGKLAEMLDLAEGERFDMTDMQTAGVIAEGRTRHW